MAGKSKTEDTTIQVLEITTGKVSVAILGTKPLIFNRMAEKAKRELLLPRGRMTAADKAGNVKHDPVAEFRASVYRNSGANCATRLCFPAPAFKGAMMTAALDIPGMRKTEIGRLVWVEDHSIDIYGIPKLKIDGVRSADMKRTPDMRTRAILPEWACVLTLSFVRPKLTETGVLNLIAAGGVTSGVGDFRQEKGKGSFGQYAVAESDDPAFIHIRETMGREAQDEALQDIECFDADSAELLEWYEEQIRKRGRDTSSSRKSVKLAMTEATANA